MKARRRFLLMVAAILVLASLRVFAETPITFELLATFDYPEGSNTNARAINERGDVAGSFSADSSTVRGFVRFSDGRFTAPIVEPSDTGGFTVVSGLNNLGAACGFFSANGPYVGFLYSDSTFTPINLGATNTVVAAVNDAGNYCGYLFSPYESFVIINGNVTYFTIPGADITSAFGINNLNQVVGSYSVGSQQFGFRRHADGTLDYPIAGGSSPNTSLFGLNDKGMMVGRVGNGIGGHAAVFRSPGQFAVYDYPGASYTDFEGINSHSVICGTYLDANGAHGFIVRARISTGE